MRNSSLQNQAESANETKWSKLRYLPHLIVYLGMLNFLLFFFSVLLLGGDGLNGKVDAGHYYLSDHGVYTEVIYPVYLLSRFWGITLFVTWPLVMLSALLAWGINHSRRDDVALRLVNLGGAYGLLEGFFSWLFDAWRKPDLEFFTRRREADCLAELIAMPTALENQAHHSKSLDLTWGGHHFELNQRAWSLFDLNGSWDALTALHGRFQSTPHGTYVKAWYRFSTFPLLFFSIFAMGVLAFPVFGMEWLVAKIIGTYPWVVAESFTPIWPIYSRLSLVIGALLLIALSSWWGRHRRRELAHLVKDVLKEA
jgi:hypothetical protein